MTTPRHIDAAVIGAGFGGLYMLHRLRELGLSARVIERAAGVGGTWYWNRYPGARCDIESIDYQYSFSREILDGWEWSERYAAQPEILRYIEFVADRLDLRCDIDFETCVTAATFDETTSRWRVETDGGVDYDATYLILAVGNLSAVKRPNFPGLDSFEGRWFHTAEWPHEPVDFSGQRVGIVGTGSTGIQAVTTIAPQAGELYVFQRTPNYSMPARNRPLDREFQRHVKRGFAERRRLAEHSDAGVPFPEPRVGAFDVADEERRAMYEAGWTRGGINALSYAFDDFFRDEAANATAADFARDKIREVVVDAETAEALCPSHHIGTRRTTVDTGYFEVFNRDNVHLVDVRRSPIEAMTPTGIMTADEEYDLDVLIFAIGFDAMTGALLEIDIRGRDGLRLQDKWADGPRTYLGLTVSSFPNMFVITGPGSPSVLSNMVVSIEQHVDWIADCIEHMGDRRLGIIEPTPEAEQGWVDHVNDLADRTLYPQANSWYVGTNIPGKPRVFMPYVAGCATYRKTCDVVAAQGYAGFALQPAAGAVRIKESITT